LDDSGGCEDGMTDSTAPTTTPAVVATACVALSTALVITSPTRFMTFLALAGARRAARFTFRVARDAPLAARFIVLVALRFVVAGRFFGRFADLPVDFFAVVFRPPLLEDFFAIFFFAMPRLLHVG
jgi:hypothetical protein